MMKLIAPVLLLACSILFVAPSSATATNSSQQTISATEPKTFGNMTKKCKRWLKKCNQGDQSACLKWETHNCVETVWEPD